MQENDFILLSEEGARNYIASQPSWKRKSLVAQWKAGEADRQTAANVARLEGKPYRAGYFYKDAYGLGRTIGGAVIAISIFVILAGIIVPATTSSGYGEVVNLHSGIVKIATLVFGFGLLISGILLVCLNEIAEKISGRETPTGVGRASKK